MGEDQIVSANDTDVDAIFQQRRDALNRLNWWMLQLPMKDRRRRWGEYLARMCQLDQDVEREIKLKKTLAARSARVRLRAATASSAGRLPIA